MKKSSLKVLYNLQKFEIYLSDYLSLEKIDTDLFLELCNDYR